MILAASCIACTLIAGTIMYLALCFDSIPPDDPYNE